MRGASPASRRAGGGTGAGAAYRNPVPLVRLYGLTTAAATKAWDACISYFDPNNLAAECPLADVCPARVAGG